MQARISRNELLAFKLQASNIVTNTIMPILTYIRIEVKGDTCTMTKNNLKSFVVRSCEAASEDCCFLVVENILNNFIDFSSAETIDFEQVSNRIKISDDRSFVESPTERAVDYPLTELPGETAWAKVSKRTTNAVGIACKLIFNAELADPKSHVFIGRGAIAATDGMVGYAEDCDDLVPDIVLRKEVAETVAKLTDGCEYSCNSSYDFFRDTASIFGFSRGEMNFYDVNKLIERMEPERKETFKVPKSVLIKFSSLCVASITTKSTIPSAAFKLDNGRFILTMEESDIKIESFLQLGGDTPLFKFNPGSMKTLLNSLNCDSVSMFAGEKRYFITDESRTFASVIMGII